MAGALSLRHLNPSASRLPAPSCVEMSMLARAQGKGQTTAARSAGVGACFVLSVFNSSVYNFDAARWLGAGCVVRMPGLEQQLVSRAPSQHGRRWRSLVCAVTRNEWHLREWLLRTLHVGVSHIVLVDDNHAGLDQDISALLRPLVALGLVTHVPSARCGDQCVAQKSWVQPLALKHKPLALAPPRNAQCPVISQDDVHARTRACVRKHSNLTDWLLLVDTDEHIYAEHDGVTRDALSHVLGLLEHEGGHGTLVPWSMMYGEQLTLEAQIPLEGGLMQAFPRVLSVAQVRIAHTRRLHRSIQSSLV